MGISGGGGQSTGTTVSNQASAFTPPPWAAAAGQQAMQTGQSLAQMPFPIQPQPIAPLQPQQSEAFQTVENLQGAYTPFVDAALSQFPQASQYVQQGSQNPFLRPAAGFETPFGASQYYGAETAGVVPQLANIFGQQMAQTTGQGVQQAGGTGADRIAVAQAQLANQQGLSAGQTLSQLMQQAVSQGQQAGVNLGNIGATNSQLLQSAGQGIGGLGTQAGQLANQGQQMGLQGANAELAAGTQQQQQLQNQMNALWQNNLQNISWPFQTNSYLASLASGITPSMGGSGFTSGETGSQMKSSNIGGSASMGGLGGLAGSAGGGRVPSGANEIFKKIIGEGLNKPQKQARPVKHKMGMKPIAQPLGYGEQPSFTDQSLGFARADGGVTPFQWGGNVPGTPFAPSLGADEYLLMMQAPKDPYAAGTGMGTQVAQQPQTPTAMPVKHGGVVEETQRMLGLPGNIIMKPPRSMASGAGVGSIMRARGGRAPTPFQAGGNASAGGVSFVPLNQVQQMTDEQGFVQRIALPPGYGNPVTDTVAWYPDLGGHGPGFYDTKNGLFLGTIPPGASAPQQITTYPTQASYLPGGGPPILPNRNPNLGGQGPVPFPSTIPLQESAYNIDMGNPNAAQQNMFNASPVAVPNQASLPFSALLGGADAGSVMNNADVLNVPDVNFGAEFPGTSAVSVMSATNDQKFGAPQGQTGFGAMQPTSAYVQALQALLGERSALAARLPGGGGGGGASAAAQAAPTFGAQNVTHAQRGGRIPMQGGGSLTNWIADNPPQVQHFGWNGSAVPGVPQAPAAPAGPQPAPMPQLLNTNIGRAPAGGVSAANQAAPTFGVNNLGGEFGKGSSPVVATPDQSTASAQQSGQPQQQQQQPSNPFMSWGPSSAGNSTPMAPTPATGSNMPMPGQANPFANPFAGAAMSGARGALMQGGGKIVDSQSPENQPGDLSQGPIYDPTMASAPWDKTTSPSGHSKPGGGSATLLNMAKVSTSKPPPSAVQGAPQAQGAAPTPSGGGGGGGQQQMAAANQIGNQPVAQKTPASSDSGTTVAPPASIDPNAIENWRGGRSGYQEGGGIGKGGEWSGPPAGFGAPGGQGAFSGPPAPPPPPPPPPNSQSTHGSVNWADVPQNAAKPPPSSTLSNVPLPQPRPASAMRSDVPLAQSKPTASAAPPLNTAAAPLVTPLSLPSSRGPLNVSDPSGGGGPQGGAPWPGGLEYPSAVRALESGGNQQAIMLGQGAPVARTGSNVGRYQFSPDQFKSLGMQPGENPTSAAVQDRMFANETRDNAMEFRKQFGRDPTGDELYRWHQQGQAGGSALSNPANANLPASSAIRPFYPNPRIANQAIMGQTGSRDIAGGAMPTAGQFNQHWAKLYDQAASPFQVTSPSIGAEPSPQTFASIGQQRGGRIAMQDAGVVDQQQVPGPPPVVSTPSPTASQPPPTPFFPSSGEAATAVYGARDALAKAAYQQSPMQQGPQGGPLAGAPNQQPGMQGAPPVPGMPPGQPPPGSPMGAPLPAPMPPTPMTAPSSAPAAPPVNFGGAGFPPQPVNAPLPTNPADYNTLRNAMPSGQRVILPSGQEATTDTANAKPERPEEAALGKTRDLIKNLAGLNRFENPYGGPPQNPQTGYFRGPQPAAQPTPLTAPSAPPSPAQEAFDRDTQTAAAITAARENAARQQTSTQPPAATAPAATPAPAAAPYKAPTMRERAITAKQPAEKVAQIPDGNQTPYQWLYSKHHFPGLGLAPGGPGRDDVTGDEALKYAAAHPTLSGIPREHIDSVYADARKEYEARQRLAPPATGVDNTRPDIANRPTNVLEGQTPVGQGPNIPQAHPHATMPSVDRSRFVEELQRNPQLMRRLAIITAGEVGQRAPLKAQIVQTETAFNRAIARGISLEQALRMTVRRGDDGYYPPSTFQNGATADPQYFANFERNVLPAVLSGSNLSDIGYGPMTGNASADVAAHQFANGTPGYKLQGGDTYFREGPFNVAYTPATETGGQKTQAFLAQAKIPTATEKATAIADNETHRGAAASATASGVRPHQYTAQDFAGPPGSQEILQAARVGDIIGALTGNPGIGTRMAMQRLALKNALMDYQQRRAVQYPDLPADAGANHLMAEYESGQTAHKEVLAAAEAERTGGGGGGGGKGESGAGPGAGGTSEAAGKEGPQSAALTSGQSAQAPQAMPAPQAPQAPQPYRSPAEQALAISQASADRELAEARRLQSFVGTKYATEGWNRENEVIKRQADIAEQATRTLKNGILQAGDGYWNFNEPPDPRTGQPRWHPYTEMEQDAIDRQQQAGQQGATPQGVNQQPSIGGGQPAPPLQPGGGYTAVPLPAGGPQQAQPPAGQHDIVADPALKEEEKRRAEQAKATATAPAFRPGDLSLRPSTPMPSAQEAVTPNSPYTRYGPLHNLQRQDLSAPNAKDDEAAQVQARNALTVQRGADRMERALAAIRPGEMGPYSDQIARARAVVNQFADLLQNVVGPNVQIRRIDRPNMSLEEIKGVASQLMSNAATSFAAGHAGTGPFMRYIGGEGIPNTDWSDPRSAQHVLGLMRAEAQRSIDYANEHSEWTRRGLAANKFDQWFEQTHQDYNSFGELYGARNEAGSPILNKNIQDLLAHPELRPEFQRVFRLSNDAMLTLMRRFGGQQ